MLAPVHLSQLWPHQPLCCSHEGQPIDFFILFVQSSQMLFPNWFTCDCSAVFGGLLVFESGADVYVMLSPVKNKHVIKILLLLEILRALFDCSILCESYSVQHLSCALSVTSCVTFNLKLARCLCILPFHLNAFSPTFVIEHCPFI